MDSQISHHAGVQFTMFPSHTIELTNHTRDENPVQKMNRHVPAFQLEASVRCQVSGTDAEVKASREKTVNAWLAAGILEQDGWLSEIWRWGYARLLLWIRADGKQVVGSGASTGRKRMWVEIQEQSGTGTTECLRILKRARVRDWFLLPRSGWRWASVRGTKGKRQRTGGGWRAGGHPVVLIVIVPVKG